MASTKQIADIAQNAQTELIKRRFASQLKDIESSVADMDMGERVTKLNTIRSTAATESPKNSEELWHYIKAVYGKELAYTATTEDCQSPFEYYSKMWFSKEEKLVALASRGGGKTDLASIFIDMCGNLRPGYEIVHAAGTKVQASVIADYLNNFYHDPVLKPFFASEPPRESALWRNRAKLKIATGTMKGVSGQHSNGFMLDEAEFWKQQDIQQTLEVPLEKNGYQRLWAAFSTRQRCLPYYTRVTTEDGPMKIGDIVNKKYGGKVKSWNTETKTWEWKQVTQWHRNGSSTEWYKVYLKYTGLGRGCELVATGDHHVYYSATNKKPLREFTTADNLCLPSWKPSNLQEQVLFGTLLGDGCITKGSLSITHSAKQKTYLDWKSNVLSDIKLITSYSKKRHHYQQLFKTNPYIYRLRSEWYPEGVKRIPTYVWDILDARGLAVWLMDDGCYRKRTPNSQGNWHIYCNHFNEQERIAATKFFKKLGIEISWYNQRKDQFYIYVGGDSATRLKEIVKDYLNVETHIAEGGGYKTWVAEPIEDEGTEGIELVPIERIEIETTQPQGCYDIGVEDNHNYLNGSNVLVSNSWGGMAWLLDEAPKRGIATFKWSAFETMKPCKRCLGYNSPVMLADGTTVPIGKLVNQRLEVEVKCFDKTSKTFVNRKVTDWIRLPIKDSKWYRLGLKTSVSRTIGSVQNPYGVWITGDHKIPTERGDVEVQDLQESDRILTTYTKPNNIQQQMVDGMLLGDAHLQKPRIKKDNSRFTTAHTEAHNSYVDATANALSGIATGVYDSPQYKQTKPTRSVQTGASPYWTEQRDRWYNKGVKIVPEDLILTPLVLATWYMDDGSINVTHDKFRRISLHTQGFGSTSFWRLFYKLVELGFKPTATVGDTTGMVINMGESNGDVDRFLTMVSPYVLPCFRYKVVGDYQGYDETLWDMGVAEPYYSQFEVQQGTPAKHHHPETVFCIEVEEHHNFVVNKMVVNNCIAIDAHPNYRGEATDKAREEVCILWKACRGERAKKATGWYPLEEIQDKCVRLGGPDGREWHTQGLCDRPSSHGLVIFNFDHVHRPDGNYSKWTYQPELPWYASHDPAEGKKSVIYFIQVYEGKSFVFDERIITECPDVTAAKQDFYDHCLQMGYGDPDVIVVDPHRTDAVATWKFGTPRGTGINRKYNADTPDISEAGGVGQLLYKTLDNLREYVCNGKGERGLFINPDTCPGCVRGLKEHHYPTDMNNVQLSNKPDEAYKDEVDPLRYWVMYLRTKFGTRTGRIVIL